MRSTKVSSKETKALARQNIRLAKCLTRSRLGVNDFHRLRHLTTRFGFSLAIGDLQFLNGSWYVTHSGLLRLAERNHCSGIRVQPIGEFCDPNNGRWVFKATVYKSPCSKGFVGYGDADPSNVSFLVGGAEMRVAETRAVNRALRKAYGIGLCSVEELAFARDFCGTETLKEASRDLVEAFITHLAEWAGRDHPGLLSKLNSFAPSQEVHS